jgi:hypothetical protein
LLLLLAVLETAQMQESAMGRLLLLLPLVLLHQADQ